MYGVLEIIIFMVEFCYLDGGVIYKVDIWLMGCIYFEMFIWINFGEVGWDECLVKCFKEGGFDGVFYNWGKEFVVFKEMLELMFFCKW